MKKVFISCIILFLLSPFLNAQELRGGIKFVDEKGNIVQDITINIKNKFDSTLIKGSLVPDKNGIIYPGEISESEFLIQIESLKYESSVISETTQKLTNGALVDSPIILQGNAKQLLEVLIVKKKEFISYRADRLVVNLNNIASKDANVFDIVRLVPGFIVGNKDKLTFEGRGNIAIEIDNKLEKLNPDGITAIMKTLTKEKIASIEIITSASAKYDADHSGPIIVIKRKKVEQYGFKNTLSGNYSFSGYHSGGGTYVYAYTKKKLNISGLLNRSIEQHIDWINESRRYLSTTDSMRLRSKYFQTKNTSFATLSASYELNKNTSLGLDGDLFNLRSEGQNELRYTYDTSEKTLSQYRSDDRQKQNGMNYAFGGYMNRKIDTAGSTMIIRGDFVSDNQHLKRTIETISTLNVNKLTNILSDQKKTTKIATLKWDFDKKLSKLLSIDIGSKVSVVSTTDNLTYDNFKVSTDYDLVENVYRYKESVTGGYTNLKYLIADQYEIQAGVRVEGTYISGTSVNKKSTQRYANVFPSASIGRTLGKKQNTYLALSYSKKIHRPKYALLNPTPIYSNQFIYRIGNPNLRPEILNRFEGRVVFFKKYSIATSYELTNRVISTIVYTEGANGILYSKPENLSSSKAASLSLSLPFTLRKLYFTSSTSLSRSIISGSLRSEPSFQNKITSLYTGLSGSLQLANSWKANVSAFYVSPTIVGQMRYYRRCNISLALSRNWKGDWSTTLNIEDPFHINWEKYSIINAEQKSTTLNRWNSTKASIAISKSFNYGKNYTRTSIKKGNTEEIIRNK